MNQNAVESNRIMREKSQLEVLNRIAATLERIENILNEKNVSSNCKLEIYCKNPKESKVE